MAKILGLHLTIDTAPMQRSIAALCNVMASGLPKAVLAQFDGLFERTATDSFVVCDDAVDLLTREFVCASASTATKLEPLQILPGDLYCKLVSAIAADVDGCTLSWFHGWPVLSLGSDSTSVTQAGGVDNPAGEGADVVSFTIPLAPVPCPDDRPVAGGAPWK